jgi:hypothetical protein
MRYREGTIALSDTRDYPLLQRVLHCGFVTSAQLYEFLKLDYCAASRNGHEPRSGVLNLRSRRGRNDRERRVLLRKHRL